jgi:hypothetical protein
MTEPVVPWALPELLREGPTPPAPRPLPDGALDVALVLAPGVDTTGAAGVPGELLDALGSQGAAVRAVVADAAEEAQGADVVLAAGWPAAPTVLRLAGVRARALLATADPMPFAELDWSAGLAVLGPAWMGGTLPPAADAAYRPQPVLRRDDLVLVHGTDAFGLLAAAELAGRRGDLSFAVTGAPQDLVLPFPFVGVEGGARALADAFSSATVAFAPPVRGWRPAAVAMLACAQTVVAPDAPAARAALGDGAALATGPLEAAGAAAALLEDLALRADRARAGLERVRDWPAVAAALVEALRAL